MTASPQKIERILGRLALIFGRPEQHQCASPEDIASAWQTILGDTPEDELQKAALQWARIGKRFPYPADLLELSGQEKDAALAESADRIKQAVIEAAALSGGSSLGFDPEGLAKGLIQAMRLIDQTESLAAEPKA